jgi:predicted regulator of Ras-like GTPase activity (Roadblock/LC7/MglB family)
VPFKNILHDLVEATPGATGAILADWEGEAVEQYCHFDEFEMKVIGAHKGIILSRVCELHQRLAVGEIEDMAITTEGQQHLIGSVGPDYVVVMTLGRDALPACALRQLRMAVELFKKEIY